MSDWIDLNDGTLTKRPHPYVQIDDIVDRIVLGPHVEVPRIVLGIGPVRSGTTASLRVYGESGIPAYSQPIKSIFRHLAKRKPPQECGWVIPNAACIYIKETLGLFNPDECMLNPLEVMLRVIQRRLRTMMSESEVVSESLRLLARQVHIVVLGRHPFDSWYSTTVTYRKLMEQVTPEERWYYENTFDAVLENYMLAYRQVENLRWSAHYLGIPTSHYVAEANTVAEAAYRRLFERIGLTTTPAVRGWTGQSYLGANESFVTISRDQETQQRAGLFDRVNRSYGIKFEPGLGAIVPPSIKNAIVDAGLVQIYERWLHNTKVELGIDFEAPMYTAA